MRSIEYNGTYREVMDTCKYCGGDVINNYDENPNRPYKCTCCDRDICPDCGTETERGDSDDTWVIKEICPDCGWVGEYENE